MFTLSINTLHMDGYKQTSYFNNNKLGDDVYVVGFCSTHISSVDSNSKSLFEQNMILCKQTECSTRLQSVDDWTPPKKKSSEISQP